MQDIKQQEEMNNRIQELHNWYIENQIILHPERDEVFKNKLLPFIQSEISLAVEQEKKRCINIILKRTEIPKGARNPTRDFVVVLGEELVDLINNK